jgi:N-acetylglucosamine kinase-like BadF-type ATPase
MRRDFAGQLNRGNYKEGFTNMGNYAMSIGLAGGAVGTARDILQTKELRPEQFDDKVFETWMSLLFLNKYTRDRYLAEGEVGQAVLGVVTPAIFNIADQGGKALQDILFEAENDPKKFNDVLKNIPVIGKLGYYWLLGGAERKLEQERKQEERDRNKKLYGG